MLANGVVVQSEVFGELGDIRGFCSVGDVSEDAVTRRVAERLRLESEARAREEADTTAARAAPP